MSTIIKLQIPMDKSLRDGLEAKATSLGFSSAQEYIRVWAKAQVDDRKIDFDDSDDWGQPSPEAATRLNKASDEAITDLKAGKLKAYTTVEEMMKHLNSL